MKAILLVGFGSFIGGTMRYLTNLMAQRYFLIAFPLGTFIANILGCFLIGVFFALSERNNAISPEWRLFLTTGFCGGYTTFSSFSLESLNLLRGKEYFFFSLNVGASIILGISATIFGVFVVRLLSK
jgi:fluoride exporter